MGTESTTRKVNTEENSPLSPHDSSLSNGGDTLDLDQEIRMEQAFDHDQSAGRQLSLEDLTTNLSQRWEMLDVGDVGGNLHQVFEITTSRLQDLAEVLENLTGLGAHVPCADDVAIGVPGHLA